MRIVIAAAVAAVALLPAAASSAQTAGDSVIVSVDWLAKRIADPRIVVLDVEHDDAAFAKAHIPGARMLSYMDIQDEKDGVHTELPPADKLRDLFQSLGVSTGSHVVLYSSMAPMASRAFFTLDYLGNTTVSILNGGLAEWTRRGNKTSSDAAKVVRGTLTPSPRPRVVVEAPWLKDHLGTRGFSLIDTRSDTEYIGAGMHRGMPSAGHLAGAKQLQWEQLFQNSAEGLFLPRAQLAKLYADRVTPGDTVITYCYVGYRASMTYLAARALGYPVRLYDGSYEDWAKRAFPVVRGR